MEDKNSKDSLNDKRKIKQKTSMRESAARSRQKADKPKRVRKAAGAAKRPVSKIAKYLTLDFHLFPVSEVGFFTKRRRITPRYFIDSAREMRNVTWPARKETWRLVLAVFLFSAVLGVSIALLDFVFEKLLRFIIF